MNKQALIARVQRHMGAGASRDAARAAVNAVLEALLQTAEEEGKASLPHLGIFEYREHLTRNGKGLPSGKEAAPKSTRRLCFRPARSLKKLMEGHPTRRPAQ